MKVSKSLLRVIAVAVTVGTATTSCTKIEEEFQEKKQEVHENCISTEKGETFNAGNCPACGMG